MLTVRMPGAEAIKPLRVVLDSNLHLPPRSRLCATAHEFPTLVIASETAPLPPQLALEELGVEIARVAGDAAGHVDLGAALQLLAQRGITRVFSEGGPRVAAALIAQGLADEVILFTAMKPLGRRGVPALARPALAALDDPALYREVETAHYGADTMRRLEKV